MNKEQYIRSKFRNILSETIDQRVNDITEKLNLDKETELYKDNEFDYVQEGNGETCEQCGSEMNEGECKECGYKSGEVMEFDNKKLNKISRKDIEDLLDDIEDDLEGDELDEGSYEMKEKLYGKQHKLDKNKNGKIDAEDFKMLRKQQNEEDDFYEIDVEDELDEGSYEMKEKLYGKQHKLDKNKNGKIDAEDFKMLRKQQDEDEQLYEIEFEVEKEDINEKWEGDVEVKQTGEYSDMSIEELNSAIKKQKEKNEKLKKQGKKVPHADRTKMSQLYFAKRAKQGWKGKGKAKVTESILYTESDLVDLIERLVNEEKNNIKVKEPKGYREYEKAHKADKKENEDYLKSVAKKMTDYLKGASDEGSKYEMKETKKFPTENGGLKKGIRKKYTPSDAVDEYIDAFSYPGQTNLRFDEVKPNKKNIEKYLKGDSTTGNAQVDKDGNALGNVVPSEVGEKFYKNFEENLYGQEQADASYKRYSQPVDIAGDDTEEGSLKSKKGKKTSKGVLDKVDESIDDKKKQKLNEEFEKIQKLMGYNQKTQ